jgi:hypothetical protein
VLPHGDASLGSRSPPGSRREPVLSGTSTWVKNRASGTGPCCAATRSPSVSERVPAKRVGDVSEEQAGDIARGANEYVERAKAHRESLGGGA